MKRLFYGGIHPQYQKELSTGSTEYRTIEPKQVVIPLLQHIGAPCKPLVNVGDRVLRGQKIGDGEGLCVPVHASVSGTVAAIEERPHPSGRRILSIVIDNDFQDETQLMPVRPLEEMDPDEILSVIREAGLVGMGGAAFPGNVKALSSMGKVDTLIANACECEPYITADDSLLRMSPESILQGTYPQIELAVLPTRYPQGSEKQLIQALTGREVAGGKLPVELGCAVFNVSTFAAIYRALREGKALTQRLVTVSGEAINKPQNFIVRIGTPFRDLIEAAGGMNDMTERVISGGPMMGFAQADLSVPVVKATNSILCLPKDKNGAAENPVCIRCGKCVQVCPMRLQPLYLYRFTNSEDLKALQRLNLLDCIECGSCAFTCPGKLPLVERFRKGKQMLREAKSK